MSPESDTLSREASARAGRVSIEMKIGEMDAGDAVVSTRLHCKDEDGTVARSLPSREDTVDHVQCFFIKILKSNSNRI